MAFTLRDYEIIDTIGSGAFGSVYRARQKSLGRIVAIKSLAPQRAQDKTEIMRFRREAQAMAALAHDNVISVYDYAYHGGSYYIVMEYVEGFTFEQALDESMPLPLSVEVLRRVADGLACAHRSRIIHRDIKPSNILLGANGRVKLADFGLAAFQQALTSQSTSAAVGTLCYMAPETMVNPGEVDVRADVFSLGCVLYQALSGRLPFPGNSIAEVSYRLINEEAPPLELSEELAAAADLTRRCLDKDRQRRPSAAEIARELGGIARGSFPAAAEELAGFVRGEGARPAAALPVAAQRRGAATGRAPRVRAGVVAGGILAALMVVAVVVSRRSAEHADSLLPDVHPENGALTVEPAPGRSRGRSAPVNPDGPAPLTSLSADERTATLVLTGLTAGDTILVNGRTAHVSRKAGSLGLPLEVGESRLEVRGAGDRRLSRSITATALQVITWDLNERASDE